MNESTTYTYTGEKYHAVFGRYDIGSHYVCLKDHSLLDTQILLVDEEGEQHWEDYHNFQCCYTPILVSLIVEYQIDNKTTHDYWINKVWYEELDDDVLKEVVVKELGRYCSHPIRVIKIDRGGYDGL